ncbi:MAG: Malonyl-CoA decarboxylase, partial [Zoogloea sp.]
MSATDLLARSLSKVRALVSAGQRPREASERDIARLRQQLQECAESRGGEVSTRQRAARLAEAYLRLNDNGRRRFLLMIALEFGPDPARVAKANEAYQAAVARAGQWDAEAHLRGAMRSRRLRILT